jgi:hypothetical protein
VRCDFAIWLNDPPGSAFTCTRDDRRGAGIQIYFVQVWIKYSLGVRAFDALEHGPSHIGVRYRRSLRGSIPTKYRIDIRTWRRKERETPLTPKVDAKRTINIDLGHFRYRDCQWRPGDNDDVVVSSPFNTTGRYGTEGHYKDWFAICLA